MKPHVELSSGLQLGNHRRHQRNEALSLRAKLGSNFSQPTLLLLLRGINMAKVSLVHT